MKQVRTHDDALALAVRLDDARRARRAIPACGTTMGLDLDSAYVVQRAWLDLRRAAGRRLVGYKIGFTGEALQRQFGATRPTVGVVLDDMIHAEVLPDRFIAPRAEMELAMVMGTSIGGAGRGIADVLDAVDHVRPAFEIIDNRIGPPPTLVDIVADNAGCAGIVPGGRATRPDAADLSAIGATLFVNGVAAVSGTSFAVLGHPARAVIALLDHLAAYGEGLNEGQIVLTGAFAAAIAIRSGDAIHADFGPLGILSTRFS